MRTREDIETDAKISRGSDEEMASEEILEVLLDIRELLMKQGYREVLKEVAKEGPNS